MSDAKTLGSLVGRELDGGWTITAEVARKPGQTGGNFSKCFLVSGESGLSGFLKAIDYSRALGTRDPAKVLQPMLEAFNYERALLYRCRDGGLSKVVRPLAEGTFLPPGVSIPVQYLIFERAEGDAREQLIALERLDHAWALRTLHQMAVALWQLHSGGIAHQDLKPSNVLRFNGGREAKIGDMGRASLRGSPALHDRLEFAGDPAYAPPELLYGAMDPDWNRRRIACDLYLLGSLAISFYLGVPITSAILAKLDESHHSRVWGDRYADVLPYVRAAFNQVINEFASEVPKEVRLDLALIRHSFDTASIQIESGPDGVRDGVA